MQQRSAQAERLLPTPDGRRVAANSGSRWSFSSWVARAADFPHAVSGPIENSAALLSDNTTVLSVYRMDGDGACTSSYAGKYHHYQHSVSTDRGRTFRRSLGDIQGAGCARPRLHTMPSGLLLSGGRLCVEDRTGLYLWSRGAGPSAELGSGWAKHSLSYWHNRMWGGDPQLRFDEQVNTTFSTQAYTKILPTADEDEVLVTYNMYTMPRANASCWLARTCEQRSYGFAMRVSWQAQGPGAQPVLGAIQPDAQPWTVYTPSIHDWCSDERAACGLHDAGIKSSFSQPPLALGPGGKLITQSSGSAATYFSSDGGVHWQPLCPSPPGGCRDTETCGEGAGMLRDGTLLVATNFERPHSRTTSAFHRADIAWASNGSVSSCTWGPPQPVPTRAAGDQVGAAAARRFVQAPNGHVYYGLQSASSGNPETAQAFTFEGLYVSTDSGRSFALRSAMPPDTGESDVLPLNDTTLIAATRLQDGHGAAPMTIPGPHYKQTALTVTTDSGLTWSEPAVVTGGLQQTACLVLAGDALLLVFGHKDNGQGQRFRVSYDRGATFSNTIFDLHHGGMYASTVLLPSSDMLVTVMAGVAGSSGLTVLRWRLPPKAVVERGGFFRPPKRDASRPTGTFVPWNQTGIGLNQTCVPDVVPAAACWSRYFPRVAPWGAGETHRCTVEDAFADVPAAAVSADGEVLVLGKGSVWRSRDDGQSFQELCPLPAAMTSCADELCAAAGLGLLRDGTLMAMAPADNASLLISRAKLAPDGCSWAAPSTLPIHAELALGSGVGSQILEAADGTILLPLVLATQPPQAVLFASSSGSEWKMRSTIAEHVRAIELASTGTGWIAVAWIQTPRGIAPEFDQLAITTADTSLESWTPLRVVTGYEEKRGAILHSSHANAIVLGFGRRQGATHGQRFIMSHSEGDTWTATLFELESNVTAGRLVQLSDGAVLTIRGDGAGFDAVRWVLPSQASAESGGLFIPAAAPSTPLPPPPTPPPSPPPVRQPWPILWNTNWPSECPTHNQSAPSIDFSSFGVTTNAGAQKNGERVFTISHLHSNDPPNPARGDPGSIGLWPSRYPARNGGVPQNASLSKHLAKLAKDLQRVLPANFSGAAAFDMEDWQPLWSMNSKNSYTYTTSIAIVRAQHPTWSASALEAEASKQFESAARPFYEESVKLAARLFPAAKIGFYGYPWWYSSAWHVNNSALNDRLDWLLAASTGWFPTIYLNGKQNTAAYTSAVVAQAIRQRKRLAQPHPPPILPYTSLCEMSGPVITTPEQLAAEFAAPKQAGADGLVVWGGFWGAAKPAPTCADYAETFKSTVGPFLMTLTEDIPPSLKLDDADADNVASSTGRPAFSPRPPYRAWAFPYNLSNETLLGMYRGTNLLPTWSSKYGGADVVRGIERHGVTVLKWASGPRSQWSSSSDYVQAMTPTVAVNGTEQMLYAGDGIDEWNTRNASVEQMAAAGYRAAKRRWPGAFIAAWVTGIDETFTSLMRDGTFDIALIEGYSYWCACLR